MPNNNYNQWDLKFLREYPFIPFGSLMKAYGEMNSNKPVNIKQFKKDAEELFELSKGLVEKSLEKSKDKEYPTKQETDIPMKE